MIYEDYNEWVPAEPKIPEWKVGFGNLWENYGHEGDVEEISLHREFVWHDEAWHIPAIYTCNKGLVMDFCVQVPAESIRSFMDKWNLSAENGGIEFTNEQQVQIDTENPLDININPEVVLNGNVLSASHSCRVSWNPCFPEGITPEVKSAIQHYGLDPAYGWAIWRAAFPLTKEHKPQITTLSITLMQEPVTMPGPRFRVSAPGEHIALTHPVTGKQHTMTVLEYEQKEISRVHFGIQNQKFPTHYTMISYALSPNLPDSALTVMDCARSDQPRQKNINPNETQAIGSVYNEIIGGSDGPTAIFLGAASNQNKLHAACSALHFEPVNDVEWRTVFHESPPEVFYCRKNIQHNPDTYVY